jgi:hypothetical protein
MSASYELLAMPSAENFLRQLLVESTGPALDRVLFSADPGGPDRPAGLRYGVAPLPPTGGDLIDDLVEIVAAVSGVAGNSQIALICSPEQAALINLRLARQPPYPTLATTALPAGTIIALATPALVSAVQGPPEIESRRDAVVHDETDPGQIVNGLTGVMSTPIRSMFQTDCVSMRLTWQVSWAVRGAGAVSWMTR